jgi:hypothetical protein
MKKVIFLSILCVFFFRLIFAQDLERIKKDVVNLADKKMYGRGYIKNGHRKAAAYIAEEYKKIGLLPFGDNYFQEFDFSVNNIKKEPKVKLDDTDLTCGSDFLINPHCQSFSGNAEWVRLDSSHLNSGKMPQDYEGKWLVSDENFFHPYNKNPFDPTLSNLFQKAKGFIVLQKKLTHSVSTLADFPMPVIELKKDIFEKKLPKKIHVSFRAQFVPSQNGKNVIGYIKGKKNPEKFFVLTAHYDHLGMQGKNAIFYGANDNAAGVALMLETGRYFQQNPPDFSVVLMAFGGEELGLLGSRHYVFSPYFPLEKIAFLINLDLVGTGEGGLMAVNGSIFKDDFAKLQRINDEKKYFSKIQHRPKAANSDHYFFTEKGVPSFFIYLMGGTQAYHDTDDKAEQLPLSHVVPLMKMLLEFSDFYR